MYAVMATSMNRAIEGMKAEDTFKEHQFEPDFVKKLVEALKTKKKMTATEIAYIQELVQRATQFNTERDNEEQQG